MSAPKVPLLDLKAQYAPLKDEIGAAIEEVIASQWFIMGPNVQALEEDVANYCGAARAIGCASGSDALLLALMALGVGAGDEVICPSYTFFATGGAIHRIGAKPVFVDIDPVTYNMDVEKVREAADRCTRLKAIMPVHLYGQCVDMTAYMELGQELGVPIIEDAAQAIGSRDADGKPAGSRGTIGCFSFFPTKNLGCFGDGGIVTTNDQELADLMAILRVHGGKPKYYHHVVGVNSRLDALQAAVLRVKLGSLESWHKGRQRNAAHYDRVFSAAGAKSSATPFGTAGFPLCYPHAPDAPSRHIYNQYCIRVPAEIRDSLRQHLTDNGIGTEIYYPVPLHLQDCFADLGGKPGDLPVSEACAATSIALPIYAELTEEQLDHVANTIVTYVGKHAGVGSAS